MFVVDRLKELIKVNALQVAPAELEALLGTHPAVAEAPWSGARTSAAARSRSRSWSRAARSTATR